MLPAYRRGLATAASVWDLEPRALDPEAVGAALLGTLAAERSLFAGIGRIPRPAPGPAPGPGPGPAPGPERVAELGAELLARLRRAVAGPRALGLSGGLDSGTLLALMSIAPGPLRAYTVGDDFADDGELARAVILARRFGAAHHVVPLRAADLPAALGAAVRACEGLIHNGRAVASFLFYRAVAAAGERVLVSGVGADEVLLGNPAGLPAAAARRHAEHRIAHGLLTAAARAAVAAPPASPPPLDPVALLPDVTLPPEGRASAALGVAVRFPFLDPGVAGFCLALPPALRARGDTGKWLLREAVRGLVPEELRLRAKQPRLAPAGGAGWRACYEAALAPDRLRALEVIDPAAVRGLLGRAEDPAVDAVLMKLASLTHLQERIAWRASSS